MKVLTCSSGVSLYASTDTDTGDANDTNANTITEFSTIMLRSVASGLLLWVSASLF